MQVVERKTWRPACAGEAKWVGHVRLSPDNTRIAYVRVEDERAGIFVEDRDGETHEVVESEDGMLPEDVRWSPDGKWLAYELAESSDGPGRRTVGWAKAKGGQIGEVLGTTMRWHPDGDRLAVYSSHNRALALYSLDGTDVSLIGGAPDSGEPQFPPRIAIAENGKRVALCTRSTFDECLAVWVFEAGNNGSGYESSFLTEIPGHEAFCSPFWSPEGVSVGLMISHLERQKSGIVVFHGGGGTGRGHVLYENELVDPPATPVWSPNGKAILFMQTVRDPADPDGFPSQLVMLNVKKRVLQALVAPGEVFGEPRFIGKKRIVIDGDDAAYILALGKSS